ncbi:hypothetical protein ACFXP3_14480 [Streptomyces sp. NPDC059096]|uniref:hypothetical protein n=1 Tax=Streptomyces sp. NPDC059096 TaxID=3346727 RepID=UPI0036A06724
MDIDWAALASVFGVSLVATVALVGLFTLGIVGLAKRGSTAAPGPASASAAASTPATGPAPLAARAGAYLCFALCAGAVAYGISLIVA